VTAPTPESTVRRNPQVVARELAPGEGAVLLHLESAQYHGVNPIGLLIWELLETEQTVQGLLDGVKAKVNNPPPQLEADVIGFLTQMQDRELVIVE
jgi:hypothetical protein